MMMITHTGVQEYFDLLPALPFRRALPLLQLKYSNLFLTPLLSPRERRATIVFFCRLPLLCPYRAILYPVEHFLPTMGSQ